MEKAYSVAIIILYQNKVLLGKKRRDSSGFLAGEWHIPGEKIEKDECYKRAIFRCAMEEAGIESNFITIKNYLASGISPRTKKEVRYYECLSSTDKIKAGSDLEDVIWVDKKDVSRICGEKGRSLWPKKVTGYFS